MCRSGFGGSLVPQGLEPEAGLPLRLEPSALEQRQRHSIFGPSRKPSRVGLDHNGKADPPPRSVVVGRTLEPQR